MNETAKTVVAMHDLSSVGRCALTVAIPTLAAMGVQPIPAPTAVLSAHTAFSDFASQDLTDYLDACAGKWCAAGLRFDCVYTGYMATERQADIALRFMNRQPQALRVVDPVLGDDGQMYRALPKTMPNAMRRLCADADIITPNLTEAALLTGIECPHGAVSMDFLTEMLERLRSLGCETALITGAVVQKGEDGGEMPFPDSSLPIGTRTAVDCSDRVRHVNAWMSRDGEVHCAEFAPVPAAFPGTGDLFTSVLTGAVTLGLPFAEAVALAADFVRDTMRYTVRCATIPVYGVQFEKMLPTLVERLQNRGFGK